MSENVNDRDRVMLDIETLGQSPGCAILSVGAVRFNQRGLGAEFYRSVSREDCERLGLAVDEDTVAWWQDQPEAAREVLKGGDELQDVLRSLSFFYDGASEIWAKSPAFDVAILDEAYSRVGMESPWNFWDTRDVRTIEALPVAPEIEEDGVDHHALDDAKQQARSISRALEVLEDA
jgi:hypothetical protein